MDSDHLCIIRDNAADSRSTWWWGGGERVKRLFYCGRYELLVVGNDTRQGADRLVVDRYVIRWCQLCLHVPYTPDTSADSGNTSPWHNRDNQLITVMCLTLWRPVLPQGYSYEASCAKPGQAVIYNFWHRARMSKITNDNFTGSGTGCIMLDNVVAMVHFTVQLTNH